jgi:hypothetical protein
MYAFKYYNVKWATVIELCTHSATVQHNLTQPNSPLFLPVRTSVLYLRCDFFRFKVHV